MPEKLIDNSCRLIEFIFLKPFFCISYSLLQPAQNPFVRELEIYTGYIGSGNYILKVFQVHHCKPKGIPDFVCKISISLYPLLREFYIPPLCGEGCEGKSEGIGSIFLHHYEGVYNIPL